VGIRPNSRQKPSPKHQASECVTVNKPDDKVSALSLKRARNQLHIRPKSTIEAQITVNRVKRRTFRRLDRVGGRDADVDAEGRLAVRLKCEGGSGRTESSVACADRQFERGENPQKCSRTCYKRCSNRINREQTNRELRC
jgi:hypothetical protein